jgi:hypothetical protein
VVAMEAFGGVPDVVVVLVVSVIQLVVVGN